MPSLKSKVVRREAPASSSTPAAPFSHGDPVLRKEIPQVVAKKAPEVEKMLLTKGKPTEAVEDEEKPAEEPKEDGWVALAGYVGAEFQRHGGF